MVPLRKPGLSRRRLLRGAGIAGIAIALPPLEIMFNERGLLRGAASAQAVSSPKRFVLFHFPNGVHHSAWLPQAGGALAPNGDTAWALPYSLEPLASFRNDFDIVTGLTNNHFIRLAPTGTPGDEHQRAGTSFATCMLNTIDGQGAQASGGPSIDVVVAKRLTQQLTAQGGALPKFERLGVALFQENSDWHAHVSWSEAGKPVAPSVNPSQLFNVLFSNFNVDPDAAAKAAARRKSVLDYVKADIDDLGKQLGVADRVRVDEHLTAIRELERASMAGVAASCALPSSPGTSLDGRVGSDVPFDMLKARADVQIKLVAMALRCDLTRVVVYSLGSTNNTCKYPFVNITDADHEISHYRAASNPDDVYRRMVHWKVSEFALMLEELKNTVEGDRTLLDNSVVICASEFGNGDWHSGFGMPALIAGKAGQTGVAAGTGRHVLIPCADHPGDSPYDSWCTGSADKPFATLYRSALAAMGLPTDFAGGSDTLSGLWV